MNSLETGAAVIDTSASFSASAWVYLTSTAETYTVISQDGSEASGFYLKYSKGHGKWTLTTTEIDAATGTGTTATSSDGAAIPQLNTWTHLTGTYDAALRQLTLYINGKNVGSAVRPAPLWNATGSMVVGAAKWLGNRVDQFSGAIDDVQVWQRVLSSADVHALASVSVPRANFGLAEGARTMLETGATGDELSGTYVPAPVPSLQGYWKFDENSGSESVDASNNGAGWSNNIVTTGAAWVPGRSGSALHYSGSAGVFSYSQARAVNTSQSFTVSAWGQDRRSQRLLCSRGPVR